MEKKVVRVETVQMSVFGECFTLILLQIHAQIRFKNSVGEHKFVVSKLEKVEEFYSGKYEWSSSSEKIER